MHPAEQINKRHRGIRSRYIPRLDVRPRRGRHDRENKPHQPHAPQQQLSSPDAGRQERKRKRARKAEHLARRCDERGVERLGDAGGLEHAAEVVRHQPVARPLLAHAAPDQDQRAPAVAAGREESFPRGSLAGELELDGLSHFFILVAHDVVIRIAGAVVLDENLEGARFLAFSDKPARRSGDRGG